MPEQLQDKAEALGEDGRVVVNSLHTGFARLSAEAAVADPV